MVTIRRSVFLLLFMALVVVAGESVSLFFVPEPQMSNYTKQYGAQAHRRLAGLLALMDNLVTTDSDDTKIQGVNRFFNQAEFRSDIKTWGKKDYWASRLEFMGKGQGDCEDFAVAKFLTLLQLGVPEEKLFLAYVKAIGYPEAAHLVVTYYKDLDTSPLILDNYNGEILPASQRKDLIPVYSFTAHDLYIQKQQGLGKRVNPGSSKNLQKLKAIELEIHKREQ